MNIAVIDYRVIPTNPIGGCHLRMIRQLCHEHRFTVFAVEFENPCPERVTFVRVPVPTRPLFLLFILFHLIHPLLFWWHKRRTGTHFDLVQSVESNSCLGQVVYSQFCHRAFLRDHWGEVSGHISLRTAARWFDHALHALFEPLVYRKAKQIVVPSRGLAGELAAVFGAAIAHKIRCIPNPVATDRMKVPPEFERDAFRAALGFGPDDRVGVFVALGHFERKGLPLLLEALAAAADPHLALLVVGGDPGLLQTYQRRVTHMGLGDRVRFVGMQQDVRPFLWASDLFVFPSAYETFSLVSFEAAAAGLPLIVSRLYGVEEIVVQGRNGWITNRTADALAGVLMEAKASPDLQELGRQAQEAVQAYGLDRFAERWRTLYAGIAAG